MTRRSTLARIGWLLVVAVATTLAGCAGTPDSSEKISTAVFYPPTPNSPRIQYLTSFSGASDIEKEQKSDLARFVLGEEKKPIAQVVKPYGVALYENKIYVADTRGSGYAIFDLNSNRFEEIFGMKKPINITIDSDGTKYVTDTELDQVLVFDRNDHRIQTFGRLGEYKPTDVAIYGNKLFVSDIQNHQIHVLNKETGEKLYTIGSAGSKEGQLFQPTNLAIDSSGNVYVSETGNFRVQEFTPDGRFMRTIGEIGTSYGKFARPKGVALDREGLLYVVDAAFQNVQVFDSDGRILMSFAGPGVGPGELRLPTDISIDYGSVAYFQKYADPGFHLEYIILVANQFGPNKVNVYGFGKMQGMVYP